MIGMTTNEATLLAAFGTVSVSAFISALVARYTVKYGPNYQQQLDDLRSEMARISTANEGMLAHQKRLADEEDARREAQAWRPGRAFVKGDRANRSNTLVLFADRPFTLTRVDVCTESGVTIEGIPVPNPDGRMATGTEFQIPTSALEKLVAPDPAYHQYGKTMGRLVYEMEVGLEGTRMTFTLPFRVNRDMDGSANWPRLEG